MPERTTTLPPVELRHLARHVIPPDDPSHPGSRGSMESTSNAWELIWFIEGARTIHRDGAVDAVAPYTITLTPPGTRIRVSTPPDQRTVFGVASLYSLGYDDPPRIRHASEDDVIIVLLEHALWLDSTRPPGWLAAIDRAIGHGLWVFVSGNSGHAPDIHLFSPPLVRVQTFLRTIWENAPSRAPTLARMAEAAAVTPVHLCRLFDKEVGLGPVATVRLIRLSHAVALLRSDLPIREIAQRTGFSSDQHFARVFKSATGRTPSEFRTDPEPELDLPDGVRRFRSHIFRPSPRIRPAALPE